MIKKITLSSLLLLVLSGCTATNTAKHNSYDLPDNAYLDGKGSKTAVILCHGRGHHPTWDVVDPLRIGIHKFLGYHTLSIQMPTTSGFENYLPLFNNAYKRIQASIDYLVKEKGITKIFLMGHSMGARMSSAFLVQDKKKQVTGYIGVGVVGGGDGSLDANSNLISVSDNLLPIIDVVANGEEKDSFDAEYRKLLISSKLKTYKQVYVTGAGHRFSGYEDEMIAKVVSWLQERHYD